MISLIFKGCLTAVVTAILLALTIIVLVCIAYAVATMIRIAVDTYKEDVELKRQIDELNKHIFLYERKSDTYEISEKQKSEIFKEAKNSWRIINSAWRVTFVIRRQCNGTVYISPLRIRFDYY